MELVARCVRQTSCPGDYAVVTVDVELSPPGSPGLRFSTDPAVDIPAGYVEALWKGVAAGLEDLELAATLVLRDARLHEVDSRPMSFEKAGHHLATQLREHFG